MKLPCALCDRPMEVAEGQLAYVHKQCRKDARRKGLKEAVRTSHERFKTDQALRAVDNALGAGVI